MRNGWSLFGYALWAMMAVRWLGDHLVIVIPVLAVIAVLFTLVLLDTLTYEGGGADEQE